MIDRHCLFAIAFLLAGISQPALAHEYGEGGITVAHPWARATPKGAKVGVAYLEIKADAKGGDRLIGASSPAAGRVEIHTQVQEGDVVKMRPVDSIAIDAGSSLVLQPSGAHVMLMDLKAPLEEGDLVTLTLLFEKAGPIEVEATVEPIGAKGPHGLDHQPGHDHSDHAPAHKH